MLEKRRLRGCARFSSTFLNILPHFSSNCNSFLQKNKKILSKTLCEFCRSAVPGGVKSPKTRFWRNFEAFCVLHRSRFMILYRKSEKNWKKAKKVLTDQQKDAIIINCIIIAWIVELSISAVKLSDSNLHKRNRNGCAFRTEQTIFRSTTNSWMEWLNQWST